MSQEPNTESNSGASQQRRLKLKRKGGAAAPPPEASAPADAQPTEPAIKVPEPLPSVEKPEVKGDLPATISGDKKAPLTGTEPPFHTTTPQPEPQPAESEDWDKIDRLDTIPEVTAPSEEESGDDQPQERLRLRPKTFGTLDESASATTPPIPPPIPGATTPPIQPKELPPVTEFDRPPAPVPEPKSAKQQKSASQATPEHKPKAASTMIVVGIGMVLFVGSIVLLVLGLSGAFSEEEAKDEAPKEVAKTPPPKAKQQAIPEPKDATSGAAKRKELIEKSIADAQKPMKDFLASLDEMEKPAEEDTPKEVKIKVESSISDDEPVKELTLEAPANTTAEEKKPVGFGKGPKDPTVLVFVRDAKISSVTPNKIALNGKVYKLGGMIDETIGLRWVGYDPALEVIYFQDENGVRYEKDYYVY